MKKCIVSLFALAATLLTGPTAFAANQAGTFAITPVIGGYHFDGTIGIDPNVLLGLKAGYNFTDRLGIEAMLHYVHTKEWTTGNKQSMDLYNYRVEALYHLLPKSSVVPFLAVGAGGLHSAFKNGSDDSGLISYGLGAKIALADNMALRTDVRMMSVFYNPSEVYNYEYTVGLSFLFGGEKPAPAPVPKVEQAKPVVVQAPKAAEAKPVPPAPTAKLTVAPTSVVKGQPVALNWSSQNADTCAIQPNIGSVQTSGSTSIVPADSTNYTLICNGDGGSSTSSAGITVTPPPAEKPVIDSDKDGVPDNMDKCPGTPVGVVVDKDGCPLDSDKDGVPNYLDKCPATPPGDMVDKDGCTLDSDKDGVADYLDKCPGTQAGVAVDKDGCPLDSDKDGVADFMDKCPGTPSGDKVDAKGCTLVVCRSVKLDIEFDTNKADIKSVYHDELKKVGDMLEQFPEATAAIEGHTDGQGGAGMNLKLSQRRADSVRQYIIDKFAIASDRISAKGYGLTKPIANNKTESGRKANRRVEAVLTCGGK